MPYVNRGAHRTPEERAVGEELLGELVAARHEARDAAVEQLRLGRHTSDNSRHAISGPMALHENAKQTSAFFPELTSEQCNSLMSGFFGIYTNDTTLPLARDNVKQLAAYLWPFVSEPTRKTFGVKYGQFTANNDAAKAKWAREFLDLVGGASYIPDSIRAAEIGTAIDELLSAHRGYNNFHIEPSFARRLESLVGDKGDVPLAVAGRYVDALVEVYLTNGNGIAWSAEPVYQRLLGKFDSSQALLVRRVFEIAPHASMIDAWEK
ncbi:hypothetical protein [Cupriavidus necator]